MDTEAAIPAPEAPEIPSTPEADDARALIAVQQAQLKRMAEIGMDVLEAIGRQAKAVLAQDEAAGPSAGSDLDLAFARASRAVRLTHVLQTRLVEQLDELESGVERKAISARHKANIARAGQVERLETVVARIASVDHEQDDEGVDRIVEEAAERLEDEDLYGDLLSRPFSEIVAHICRDLGLKPDWPRLAGEYWALDEIESGQVGAPLAVFSSPACGGGGPRSGGGGADGSSAPSVAALRAAPPPPQAGEERGLSP